MVTEAYTHVEQEQEVSEVRPTVAGGAEEGDHIDEMVQVQVLMQVQVLYIHDHDHNHE